MFDFLYEEIRVEFAGIKFEGDLMGVLLNGAVSWVGAMLITYSFMKWCAR